MHPEEIPADELNPNRVALGQRRPQRRAPFSVVFSVFVG